MRLGAHPKRTRDLRWMPDARRVRKSSLPIKHAETVIRAARHPIAPLPPGNTDFWFKIPTDLTIALAQMAALINKTFKLVGRARVAFLTPYSWWDRHLHYPDEGSKRRVILFPMPDPVAFGSTTTRDYGAYRNTLTIKDSPRFNAIQILKWYAAWKQIDVNVKRPKEVRRARREQQEREWNSEE